MADHIVACTHMCPVPKAQRAAMAVGSFSLLREEKLQKTNPDIVITATLVQAGGAKRLAAAGYTVIHLHPLRIEDIAQDYIRLGSVTHQHTAARRIRDMFLQTIEAYRNERYRRSVRVYMEEWHKPPYVSGNWVPDIVELSGGMPVLSIAGQPSRLVLPGEVEAEDPDIIIQHVCLPPLLPDSTKHQRFIRTKHRESMRQEILQRPAWKKVTAVRRQQVYTIEDSYLNMPTTNVLKGITKVQTILKKDLVDK